jgi:hypothetical protein
MTGALAGRRPVSAAWPAFHERLTETLRAMTEDQYLIVTRKETNRFVQFAAQGFYGLRAEVVCNSFLSGPERLTDEDEAMLRAFGWSVPTSGPGVGPEFDPDGSPNFFTEWDDPVDHAEVATLAVRTLIEVLDVPHPGCLEYTAFDFEGNTLVLPSLGLKRGG